MKVRTVYFPNYMMDDVIKQNRGFFGTWSRLLSRVSFEPMNLRSDHSESACSNVNNIAYASGYKFDRIRK